MKLQRNASPELSFLWVFALCSFLSIWKAFHLSPKDSFCFPWPNFRDSSFRKPPLTFRPCLFQAALTFHLISLFPLFTLQ